MEEHIDLFDAYENGELSAAETEAFTTRIEEDKAFKEAFDLYQQELSLIRAMSAGAEMRSIMDAADVPQKKSGVLVRYLIPMGVAAAFALWFFVLAPEKPQSGPELFETYFEPFPNLVSARDNATEISEVLNVYSAGDYNEAIAKLNKVAQKTDTVLFYKSISYLAVNKADSALKYLHMVNEESTFSSFTPWYKGMAYLSLQQLDSARFFLEQVNSSSVNHDSSQKVLKAIQ